MKKKSCVLNEKNIEKIMADLIKKIGDVEYLTIVIPEKQWKKIKKTNKKGIAFIN